MAPMRCPSASLLLLLLPLAVLAQEPPQTPAAPAQDPVATATRFVDLFLKGEIEAATRDFDNTMKGAAKPEMLTGLRKHFLDQLGPFRRLAGSRTARQGGYDFVFVTADFEKGSLTFRVVLDTAGRIAGFFQESAAPAAAAYEPPAYVKKDAFRESEVTVGSGEWALPGTLSVPAGPGPWPAVVLVHGSGPNDRDETLFAVKPFRDLAWGLASRDVAVLRYDKRTFHYREKLPAGTVADPQQEVVDDALAAVELLRRTPGIDPARIHVLGHSLGATMIPRIGRRDPKIAGLIVMAGAGRPLEDLIAEQVPYLVSLDGTVSDEEKKVLEEVRADIARVKALQPGATGSLLSFAASWWLDVRGYDAPAEAKALKQPLLVLQGERDYQVTMADFAAWKKALADHPGTTFESYPRLNHLFVEGEGRSTPAEYQQPGHVAEEVIADVAGWIRGRQEGGRDDG